MAEQGYYYHTGWMHPLLIITGKGLRYTRHLRQKHKCIFIDLKWSLKLLIPISDDYFIVESVDYYRIKFIFNLDEIKVKQIFSYGAEWEYSKEK